MRGLIAILFLLVLGNVASAMPCHSQETDRSVSERPKAELTQSQTDCDDCPQSGLPVEGCCDGKGGKCARACCRLFSNQPKVTLTPAASYGLARTQPIIIPASRTATPPKRPPISA